MASPRPAEGLPPGSSHPYDATGPKAEAYRHGHTFTWVRGDNHIAVQRGRVANARRVTVLVDVHDGAAPLVGRRPVVDWRPAPPHPRWGDAAIMGELADHWLRSRRAGPARRAESGRRRG
jgi:hypothetical protein